MYYTAKEVARFFGISKRTFYSWVTKIEKRTAYRFDRRVNERQPLYYQGKPRKVRMFDEGEVALFEEFVTRWRAGEESSYLIDALFLLPEDFKKKYL